MLPSDYALLIIVLKPIAPMPSIYLKDLEIKPSNKITPTIDNIPSYLNHYNSTKLISQNQTRNLEL